jgi:novobiocin biosynthesis protein NovU/D-mycarose 3-C-methyltransferase
MLDVLAAPRNDADENRQPSVRSKDRSTQLVLADWVRRDYGDLADRCAMQDADSWQRSTCRVCDAQNPLEVLSLGSMPPANAYLRPTELDKPEPRFPLSLRLCEQCGMVQLGHVVPADLLFRSYLFFTSSSSRMSQHFSSLMTGAANRYVAPGGLVVEIGSNDGTGLSSIQRRDVRVLGIDPSRNISVMAASRGVPTVSEFFTEALAHEVARVAGQAQLIVACNVLGHIDDLHDVCRGVKTLLAPSGAFVFEVPYLGNLLAHSEYDTIYHEHLSYFAIRPLVHLLTRHDLRLEEVEYFAVHGGTIRCTAVHGRGCGADAEEWIQKEIQQEIGRRQAFEPMARRVRYLRDALPARLADLHTSGRRVLGYGAPAKGAVVLNYCRVGTDLLPAVFDSTPAKQGLCVPGTHQPILPPSAVAEENPDVLLLLAWNHAAEIVERETAFRARGGVFLTPQLEELN